MGTRSLFCTIDQHDGETYGFFKHWDGYPSNMLKMIAEAISARAVWQLPRFDPDEFAAGMAAHYKLEKKRATPAGQPMDCGGDVRLLNFRLKATALKVGRKKDEQMMFRVPYGEHDFGTEYQYVVTQMRDPKQTAWSDNRNELYVFFAECQDPGLEVHPTIQYFPAIKLSELMVLYKEGLELELEDEKRAAALPKGEYLSYKERKAYHFWERFNRLPQKKTKNPMSHQFTREMLDNVKEDND